MFVPPPGPRRGRFNPKDFRGIGLLSTVGISLVLCSGFGLGIGYWVDARWHTDPWGKAMGFLFGTAAGFIEVYNAIKKANDDD